MKAFCLLLLGLNILVLIAAYVSNEYWAHDVCRSAFGLCDYPLAAALAIVACVGMFITVKEID
jgi:hypothetical protein